MNSINSIEHKETSENPFITYKLAHLALTREILRGR